jgi:hypothetical protein
MGPSGLRGSKALEQREHEMSESGGHEDPEIIDGHDDDDLDDDKIEEEMERRLNEARSENERLLARQVGEHAERIEQKYNGANFDPPQMPRDGVTINDNATVNFIGSDPIQREELRLLREQVDQLRQQVRAIQDGPAMVRIQTRYIAVACAALGVAINAAAAVIYAIKTYVAGHDTRRLAAMANVDSDNADSSALAKAWLKNSETEFWENLASFIDKFKPRSFQEQLIFTQITLDVANAMPAAKWTWRTPGDKRAAIEALVETINRKGLAAAYRSLPALIYPPENRPYTRAIAAELMSLALTQWFIANA